MCGRYADVHPQEIADAYGIKVEFRGKPYLPSYNGCPGAYHSVITNKNPDLLQLSVWGLRPFFWKPGSNQPINLRDDSIAKSSWMQTLLKHKRCLVPARGFYEWLPISKSNKIPIFFSIEDRPLFSFAGLWSDWADPTTGEVQSTFTVVTTSPNKIVQPVHDRMPVILTQEQEQLWLSEDVPMEEALSFLKPYKPEKMRGWQIRKISGKEHGPEVAEMVEGGFKFSNFDEPQQPQLTLFN